MWVSILAVDSKTLKTANGKAMLEQYIAHILKKTSGEEVSPILVRSLCAKVQPEDVRTRAKCYLTAMKICGEYFAERFK
jgi:hypothetical protein